MNTNCKSGAYREYKTIRNYVIAITMLPNRYIGAWIKSMR